MQTEENLPPKKLTRRSGHNCYARLVTICVSQALLERILGEEEEHLDWLQAQRHQIQELGYELWLVQQR